MMPLFFCITAKVSHGELSSARQRSVIRGTLVTSSVADYDVIAADDALARLAAEVAWWPQASPCRFRRSRHADGASATACRLVAAPRRAHLCASAVLAVRHERQERPMAVPLLGEAQRSRARAATGFNAVSLRASPSHLPGLGPAHRPRYGHVPCYAKSPLPSRKGPDLHKLAAGRDLNPRTLGYEPYCVCLGRPGPGPRLLLSDLPALSPPAPPHEHDATKRSAVAVGGHPRDF